MSFDKETLFRLLPAFDRLRDQDLAHLLLPQGKGDGPVKALLGLIAEQMAVLEENLEQLYDDQFIETCADWVIPYIGDLVAARGLVIFPDAPFSQRAQVANTIAYRRRKGTASMLEQLAHDVTGWDASVVEYFQLLATTQYLNHLRPGNLSVSGLKNWEAMEYVNTPFDKLARTVDVRHIESKRGKYNIPNIGIFLWRLTAYSSLKSPACKVDDRRYKFDALGKDISLYNMPVTEEEISHLAKPINVSMPLRRLVMKNYLDKYYGPDKSVLIYKDGSPVFPPPGSPPGPPSSAAVAALIAVCNLSDTPDATGNWNNMPDDKISIDPVLGRIAFPASLLPISTVQVNYYYGFSSNMGGGDYGRITSFSTELDKIQKLRVPQDHVRIQDALTALSGSGGVVEITNNGLYTENLEIHIAAGKKIELRAADSMRPVLLLSADLLVFGGAQAEVYINGLLAGGFSVRLPLSDSTGAANQLETCTIRHCTLLPDQARGALSLPVTPGLVIEIPGVQVEVDKSITGPIRANGEAVLHISNSIVDAGSNRQHAYGGLNSVYGAPLTVENTTIIGRVATRIMKLASNTIFYAALKSSPDAMPPVAAQRLQDGCVRFSYVPPGSLLPRLHNCQPADETNPAGVCPAFTSLRYGDAAYGQLSRHCAIEIRQGADNESEMGAFNNLYQPQRETNLRTRLLEYLKFGLEAGIFYGS